MDEFMKAYGELVEKHKKDFISFPVFEPDDTGGFRVVMRTQVVDTEQGAVKSFIQPE